MELQRERPPAYHSHDPDTLKLPSVPSHDFNTTSQNQHDLRLPNLQTVLSPDFQRADSPPQDGTRSPLSVRSLPRMDPGDSNNEARKSMDGVLISPSDNGSRMSGEERGLRSASVLSMDDPDVRLAAEALSGLGNPGMMRSPLHNGGRDSRQTSSPQTAQDERMAYRGSQDGQQEAEPLLELFTQAHPWLGGTINGSMSAYSTTKYYSPRLVQYGVGLMERNVGMPMVNTVGNVGKYTGVESGFRRYLGARRPGDVEQGHGGASIGKRRRLATGEDVEDEVMSPSRRIRGDSQGSQMEGLPPWSASKPPSYREEQSPAAVDRRPQSNRSWSRNAAGQLFVMTSGLTVALNQTSRRTLALILQMLSQATQHITTVMNALKMVLEQYDEARNHFHEKQHQSMEKGERPQTPDQDEAARYLAAIIKKHSDDIWHTMKTVVDHVSNTAGGALPGNARQFVRTQLMSLPQRWQVASSTSDNQTAGNGTATSETSRSAHRMIAFGMEALDMMSQVSQCVQATLDSAEKWLAYGGRRRVPDKSADDESHEPYRDNVDEEMGEAGAVEDEQTPT